MHSLCIPLGERSTHNNSWRLQHVKNVLTWSGMWSRKMWHAVHRMNHPTGNAQARMWLGLLTIVDAHGHSNDGEADGADSGDCVDVANRMEVRGTGPGGGCSTQRQ